jgi:hypothetical protein
LVEAEEEELLDDPLEVVEEQLRRDIVTQARANLERIMDALEPATAARALKMAETIAEHHREMLATLQLGDIPLRKKKRGGLYMGGDPLDLYESGVGMNTSETFGAQAITQIGATLGSAFRDQHAGKNIDNLVSAIAKAKDAGLEDVIPRLEAKLHDMLPPADEPEKETSDGEQAPTEEES